MPKLLLILLLLSFDCYAIRQVPCACLGFKADMTCHINLSPDRNRADHVWHCKNFCKKTNCQGDINLY